MARHSSRSPDGVGLGRSTFQVFVPEDFADRARAVVEHIAKE
jgi:hypothetical protein